MTNASFQKYGLAHRLVLLALLVLCTYWIFIDTYRLNAFNIVPHDDYAPYLLYLLGEEGGEVPGAPFAYRIFSVAIALPLFYLLPYFEFSRLENPDVIYLRAVEALAMASYLSMLVSSLMIYQITCRRFGAPGSTGVIAALISFFLFHYSGYKGVDPVGILVVCLIIYYAASLSIYSVLMFTSVGFNEKISLIFAILMTARVVFSRNRQAVPYAAVAVAAFGSYLMIRVLLNVPGNEDQLDVANFLATAWNNFAGLPSLKNVVLIVVPLTTLTVLFLLAGVESRGISAASSRYFSRVDILALYGLFVVSMAVGVQSFARMAMFCFPICLPLAAMYIARVAGALQIKSG